MNSSLYKKGTGILNINILYNFLIKGIDFMKKYFFIICIGIITTISYSCRTESNDVLSSEDLENYKELIEKYGLKPVDKSEVKQHINKNLRPISSPEQLENILKTINISKNENYPSNDLSFIPKFLKTRSEIGPNLAEITGSNSDGSASVLLQLNPASVITSTYHLGFMDAFVGYSHLGGSASGNSNIDFTAYGEGFIQIPTITEFYKFSVTITGYSDMNGNGELTKF